MRHSPAPRAISPARSSATKGSSSPGRALDSSPRLIGLAARRAPGFSKTRKSRASSSSVAAKIATRIPAPSSSRTSRFRLVIPTLGEFGMPTDLTIAQSGRSIYLAGEGASPEGDRPFLDRLDLDTLKTERLFRSEGERYEAFAALAADDGSAIFTRRESRTSPPNLILRDLQGKSERALTSLTDQTPALSLGREAVAHLRSRATGSSCRPPCIVPTSRKGNERLPLIMWAYPREFTDAAAASQVVRLALPLQRAQLRQSST